jgi:membrane protease YdiL (CAAX protease family)
MDLKFKSFNFRILAEYVTVFIIFPAGLSLLKPHTWIYPILWIFAAFCYWTLRKHYGYAFKADWNYQQLTRQNIKNILIRFSYCAIALFAFTCIAIPERLFNLPLHRPGIWALVMILYPLLSVIPQEILFRSFFFRRYHSYVSPHLLILISSLAFGWTHIVLRNWVAVLFSFAGGLIFSSTYYRTRSLALICFEHALYGCYIFTIGLGFYFFHGNVAK